jgi:hypothetical protein
VNSANTVVGNGDIISVSGWSEVTVNGTSNAVFGSAGTTVILSQSGNTVMMSYGVVSLSATGVSTVVGNGNGISGETASTVDLTGTSETVAAGNFTINLGANSSVTGSGNTINATSGDTINESDAVVTVAVGGSATVSGNFNNVVAESGSTVVLSGFECILTVHGAGTNATVSGLGATVNLQDAVASTVVATGSGATFTFGSGSNAVTDSTGDGTVVLSPSESDYDITLNANGSLNVYGVNTGQNVTLQGISTFDFADQTGVNESNLVFQAPATTHVTAQFVDEPTGLVQGFADPTGTLLGYFDVQNGYYHGLTDNADFAVHNGNELWLKATASTNVSDLAVGVDLYDQATGNTVVQNFDLPLAALIISAQGQTEAWDAVAVAQMITNDPYAGAADSYGYSIVGETTAGADFFFNQGGSMLMATNLSAADIGDTVHIAVNENSFGIVQTDVFQVGQQNVPYHGNQFTLTKVA